MDSDLIARKLGQSPLIYVASPAYLTSRGQPKAPADLSAHDMLCLAPSIKSRSGFRSGGENPGERFGRIEVDEGESLARLALAGHGIAQVSRFHVRAELDRGELVNLFPSEEAGEHDVFFAVFLGGRAAPLRVRVFVDFLVERLTAYPF